MRLTGGEGQELDVRSGEAFPDGVGVKRTDVGVGDYGVAMRRGDFPGDGPDLGKETWSDTNRRRAKPDRLVRGRGGRLPDATYQVTSPAPLSTLARRASVNSKSDSRFR